MTTEEHKLLKERIQLILSDYGPWIWNELSKILSIVWKYEIKSMMEMDSELLTAEGFLNGLWREKVTPAEDIYEIFKELQLINGNHKSNQLNMAKKKTHKESVLKHLKRYKTITGREAWAQYGVYRLASVINRLNKVSGIQITCSIVPGYKHGEYKLTES